MYELLTVEHPQLKNKQTIGLLNENFEPHLEATMHLLDYSKQVTSHNTVKKRADCIKPLINILEYNGKHVCDASEEDIYTFVEQYLLKNKKLSEASINIYENHINGFFGWLAEHDFISGYKKLSFKPLVERASHRKEMSRTATELTKSRLYRTYLTKHDFDELCSYVSVSGEPNFITYRDELCLWIGYYSGCRASEVVDPDNFNIQDYQAAKRKAELEPDANGFEFDIIGKGSKVRTIFIHPSLERKIDEYLSKYFKNKNSGPMFVQDRDRTKPLNERHASTVFDNAKKNLIQDNKSEFIQNWEDNFKTRRFHALRHTYATNLAGHCRVVGHDRSLVKERLGHSDIKTTHIYIDFDVEFFGSDSDQQKHLKEIKRRIETYGPDEHEELLELDEFQ